MVGSPRHHVEKGGADWCVAWLDPSEEELTSQALERLPRGQMIEALLAFNSMKYVPHSSITGLFPSLGSGLPSSVGSAQRAGGYELTCVW